MDQQLHMTRKHLSDKYSNCQTIIQNEIKQQVAKIEANIGVLFI